MFPPRCSCCLIELGKLLKGRQIESVSLCATSRTGCSLATYQIGETRVHTSSGSVSRLRSVLAVFPCTSPHACNFTPLGSFRAVRWRPPRRPAGPLVPLASIPPSAASGRTRRPPSCASYSPASSAARRRQTAKGKSG